MYHDGKERNRDNCAASGGADHPANIITSFFHLGTVQKLLGGEVGSEKGEVLYFFFSLKGG